MPYTNGVFYQNPIKCPHPAKSTLRVTVDGTSRLVDIKHVSRETLARTERVKRTAKPYTPHDNAAAKAKRRARMRLRKRRGYR